jgi:hypothetical protein
MRHSGLFLLVVLLVAGLGTAGNAQEVLDEELSLVRTVEVGGVSPYGLAPDNETGAVYFISDRGTGIGVLLPDDTVERLAQNVGQFSGYLTDLRLGPDRLLYAAGGVGPVSIQRFTTAGEEVEPLAVVDGGATNAFGLAFDHQGNLYTSDTGDALYRVTAQGEVSVFSRGWVDVDEINSGHNGSFFIHDGSARQDGQDQVFHLDHAGTQSVYASGLPRTWTGAFDRATGDYYVVATTTGDIYRLRDRDESGHIDDGEVERIAEGFGVVSSAAWGRSSARRDMSSLYIGSSTAGRIWEIGGLTAWDGDHGDLVDDDGDGRCENGLDLNGDGDCLDDADERVEGADCDDLAPNRYRGAEEICDDGIDNNCDGRTDEEEPQCGPGIDRDGDGFCRVGQDFNMDGDCLDDGEDIGRGDCDDDDPEVNPGADELCGDLRDNDCDGRTDLEDRDCRGAVDGDGDGYCTIGQDRNDDGDCADLGETVGEGDCDDDDPDVHPGAEEVCNDGVDNNCDGAMDARDNACVAFRDLDRDSFCPVGRDINRDGDCDDADEAEGNGDCDDTNHDVNPLEDEVCTNEIDDDCDGDSDERDDDCAGGVDSDGDGYCPLGRDFDEDGVCFSPGEDVSPGDCDDTDPNRHPQAEEICGSGIDHDCDGLIDAEDDDCSSGVDGDGDGYCGRGVDLNADGDCFDPRENTRARDCDDTDPLRNPGAREICGDGIDNDCDDAADRLDDDCTARIDGDGDGHCPEGEDLDNDGECFDEDERLVETGDCDDDNPDRHPGAEEICDDDTDNDCDDDVDGEDTDCSASVDGDGDGFCPEGVDLDDDGMCLTDMEIIGPGDCDDTDPSISPAADEDCQDGLDNDCDEDVDREDADCPGSAYDADGDGYCPVGTDLNGDGDCLDDEEADGAPDCDDTNPAIHPDAQELCSGGTDEDCDGLTDEDDRESCPPALLDGDGDRYCPEGVDRDENGDCLGDGEETGPADCDDADASRHPGAVEICNERDDNCDGQVDEGLLCENEDPLDDNGDTLTAPAPEADCACSKLAQPLGFSRVFFFRR